MRCPMTTLEKKSYLHVCDCCAFSFTDEREGLPPQWAVWTAAKESDLKGKRMDVCDRCRRYVDHILSPPPNGLPPLPPLAGAKGSSRP